MRQSKAIHYEGLSMGITASRLGSSPITIDWSNLARIPSQGGPADRTRLGQVWAKLKVDLDQGSSGFYSLPLNAEQSQIQAAQAAADQFRKSGMFSDCLFLGIGGSSLGPMSAISALSDRVSE